MSLRFALLAVLSSRPRTGYDLLGIFDSSVDSVWHAPHTQIYPELRRMEADGLLASEEVPRGPKSTKRCYTITAAGCDELRRQASEAVPPSREKDSYRLKAAYMEWASPEGAREQLVLHLAHYAEWHERWKARLEALQSREDPVLRERLAAQPPELHDEIVAVKVFAYEGLLARARMEIEWAERGLELVARFKGPGTSAALDHAA